MAAVQVRKVNAQIEMVQACLGGTGRAKRFGRSMMEHMEQRPEVQPA